MNVTFVGQRWDANFKMNGYTCTNPYTQTYMYTSIRLDLIVEMLKMPQSSTLPQPSCCLSDSQDSREPEQLPLFSPSPHTPSRILIVPLI